jgi:hypothetical protein
MNAATAGAAALLGLVVGFAACGGPRPSTPAQPPRAERRQAPPAVVLELVRRPPVGTRWHEVRTYARDQDAAMSPAIFAHHYHDVIEADVTVVEQTTEREVVELVVRRHESVVDGRAYPGVQAPGARIRIERTARACKATDDRGGPLGFAAATRIFSHLFDCRLQDPTDNDDDFFATRMAHRVGDAWSLSRPVFTATLHVADADVTDATVRLAAADGGYALTATYAVPRAGASGTFRKLVPNDPRLPLLASTTDVIRETHERLRRSTVRTRVVAPGAR